jgi:hypothetical protein
MNKFILSLLIPIIVSAGQLDETCLNKHLLSNAKGNIIAVDICVKANIIGNYYEDKDQFVNLLIKLVGDRSIEELLTTEGKELLLEEISDAINTKVIFSKISLH